MSVEPEVIPLFPLSVLLVPGLVLPLHIFEPRYRALLSDVMKLTPEKRIFGLIGIRRNMELERDGIDAFEQTGTAARIDRVESLPDGRSNIYTVGTWRFRILELLSPPGNFEENYLRARVLWLDENITSKSAQLATSTLRSFARYTNTLRENGLPEIVAPDGLPDDPNLISYIVASSSLFAAAEKQELLDLDTTDARLLRSRELLNRESAIIRNLPSLPAADLADTQICPN